MSDISSRLKLLRLSKNLSHKQLAEAIGASEMSVLNYELGTRKPNYEMLIELSSYFEVSADYLLGIGVYANQDIILQHRNEVEAITKLYLPIEYVNQLSKLNNLEFMAILNLIFQKIDYIEVEAKKQRLFDCFPRFPTPPSV